MSIKDAIDVADWLDANYRDFREEAKLFTAAVNSELGEMFVEYRNRKLRLNDCIRSYTELVQRSLERKVSEHEKEELIRRFDEDFCKLHKAVYKLSNAYSYPALDQLVLEGIRLFGHGGEDNADLLRRMEKQVQRL